MKNNALNPWYVTGFIDGEGCFSLFLRSDKQKRKNTTKTYHYWKASFAINLRADDINILRKLQKYFNCGRISTSTKKGSKLKQAYYVIDNYDEIVDKVFPHFDKYVLEAKKLVDYALWKEAVEILQQVSKTKKSPRDKIKISETDTNRLFEIKMLMNKRLTGKHLENQLIKHTTNTLS